MGSWVQSSGCHVIRHEDEQQDAQKPVTQDAALEERLDFVDHKARQLRRANVRRFGAADVAVQLAAKDVLARELFLFGLGDLPILEGVRKDGLKRGESLVFGMKDGNGTITVGAATAPIPDAIDTARAFLEMSFVGAILDQVGATKLFPAPEMGA